MSRCNPSVRYSVQVCGHASLFRHGKPPLLRLPDLVMIVPALLQQSAEELLLHQTDASLLEPGFRKLFRLVIILLHGFQF